MKSSGREGGGEERKRGKKEEGGEKGRKEEGREVGKWQSQRVKLKPQKIGTSKSV